MCKSGLVQSQRTFFSRVSHHHLFYFLFFTCQYTAGDPWNTLNLCYVVVCEIIITSGVQVLRVTEGPPQFCRNGFIVYLDELCAYVVPFGHKGSIAQDADTEWETRDETLSFIVSK